MQDKRKLIGSIILTSAFWIGIATTGFYVKEYSNISIPALNINSEKVDIVKVSKNLKIGDEIKLTDLLVEKKNINDVVPGTYSNPNSIVGKIAQRNLYRNEQIKKEDVIKKDIKYNNLRPCTIPITLSNLNDNLIENGDYIDVILNYKKLGVKPDIVAPKVIVKSITDAKGDFITEEKSAENKQVPAYITFMGNLEDILLVEDAKKSGTLDCYVYTDKNSKANKRTYIPSWAKQKNENNQEGR